MQNLPTYPELKPLIKDELKSKLQKSKISKWMLLTESISSEYTSTLYRKYELASFEQAIAFVQEAAKYISELDHHPDWRNNHKTVEVRLTTWYLKGQVSVYDLHLAEYLERLYEKYV